MPHSAGSTANRIDARPLNEPDPARLSALVDAIPEPICILDSSWRFTYVNAAFERMARVQQEAMMGREVWEVFSMLLGTPMEALLRETMRQGRATKLEYGGARGSYDIDVIPFGGGLAFMVHDITELRAASDELRQKEARFRAILNTEPGAVLLLDRDGLVLDTNPAGLELFEVVTYQDLIGSSIDRFIDPADRAALKDVTREVFDGGSVSISFRLRGLRGTTRAVEHRSVPLRDSKGDIVAALSITTDVTARNEHEAVLRRRSMQNAVLASLGALAAGDPDIEDLTRRAVDAVCDTLGIPSRAALELLRKHGLTDLHGVELSGEGPSAGVRLESEDADFVRSTAHLLSSAMERRRTEDALQEREDQLRQSQKMEAIGQLAGGVAHDFNNLLTIINVHTDLLLSQMGAVDPLRGDVEEIARAATRAASLTRQLLTFSRKQVVQPQVLDMARVARGLEPMLRRLIGEDVEFETSVTDAVSPVLADEHEVEQVLINLVVNARDAMPQGGRLRVEVANATVGDDACAQHPSLRAGNYAVLTVSDSGMGMTTETMARAFEPFFTTKEPGRGTGLGLSTVYGIVKQCGGAITVDSEPGQGTVFRVYLPIATASSSRRSTGVERRQSAASTETILLVEDEDSVRRLAKRVLEAQGYTVLEAVNGEAALRLAGDYAGVIDLLLSDVVMPELGGRLLAERLMAVRPDIEVLFMSGYTDDDILRRGLLERGQKLLQKPFTGSALAHEVRTVLDAKRRRRSTASHQTVEE
ncbi:MAG TPA: PAS domain-containing protein [Gemmatimonadaceae bacterium]|nr:PAS domain-containing protein [Gemmatimonadaceae bacterium]